MTTTRRRELFARMRAVFEELVDLEPDERERRVAVIEIEDPRAAAELRILFAAAAGAPAFLDRSADAALLEGRVLGSWRIHSLLASGGMGEVYRAERCGGDVTWRAAVKVLRSGFDGASLAARFRDERRALATLQHPNIVALLDVGTLDDGRPWFVMELVEGRAIDRYCDDRDLGLDARLGLFLTVCSAVEHAHQRLTAHCDLKPANILVTDDGHVKLVDFGIAELLSGADRERPLPLTPGYASPEQVRGDSIGVASEVWSLGVVLAELAVRRRADTMPFEPSRAAVGLSWRSRLRGDFDAIVARCLAEEPHRRYGSVGMLAADVRAFLAGRTVAARDASRVERTIRAARAHPWTSFAVALAILSLATSFVLGMRELGRTREDARIGWRAHAQAVEVTRLLEALLVRARSNRDDPAAFERAVDDARRDAAITFAERPETLGRLCFAFGALYLDLGRAEKARTVLEEGLALAKSHRGFGRGDVERAEELLRRASPVPTRR